MLICADLQSVREEPSSAKHERKCMLTNITNRPLSGVGRSGVNSASSSKRTLAQLSPPSTRMAESSLDRRSTSGRSSSSETTAPATPSTEKSSFDRVCPGRTWCPATHCSSRASPCGSTCAARSPRPARSTCTRPTRSSRRSWKPADRFQAPQPPMHPCFERAPRRRSRWAAGASPAPAQRRYDRGRGCPARS